MKTEKYIFSLGRSFSYEIVETNLPHGLYNSYSNGLGYIYQGKIKGFWLEPKKN